MKKLLIFMLAAIMLFTFTACDEDTPAIDPDIITTELEVWNMTCQTCVGKITKALEGLDGFVDVSVNLNDDSVTVKHYEELTEETIIEVIKEEGFDIP